jgi:hypothetical protein
MNDATSLASVVTIRLSRCRLSRSRSAEAQKLRKGRRPNVFVETKTGAQHHPAVTTYLDVMDFLRQARGKYALYLGPAIAPTTFNGVLDVYRAKSSDRVGELLFHGGGQAARRYSLITPPTTRCRRIGASIATITAGS